MCGIVGAISKDDIIPFLINGLKKLEYRGYDSAGIGISKNGLNRIVSVGHVANLESKVLEEKVSGNLGIAHTRWATHGVPAERNSHPHFSTNEFNSIMVVHNGIIENYKEIKSKLESYGYIFNSETDTECLAHLIHYNLMITDGDFVSVLHTTIKEIHGSYAIGVINQNDPDHLYAMVNKSPMILGLGIEENFISSDVFPLINRCEDVIYLSDGDIVRLSASGYEIWNFNKVEASKTPKRIMEKLEVKDEDVALNGYKHFMQKEIFEQPEAIFKTLHNANVFDHWADPKIFGTSAKTVLSNINHVKIIACGTSFHAGTVGKYWLENIGDVTCDVEVASEFRYNVKKVKNDTLYVFISQSGETADTLEAIKRVKELSGDSNFKNHLSICNVKNSSLTRESELLFMTSAGPEIGVASTKAFSTQLIGLFLLSIVVGKLKNSLSYEQELNFLNDLKNIPTTIKEVFKKEDKIKEWAEQIKDKSSAIFIGRGIHYPIAMEGALKMKEISYIHAEAYAAGELKHGPLALIDENMPVIAMIPNNTLMEKVESNIQEVKARSGDVFLLSEDRNENDKNEINIKRNYNEWLSPLIMNILLQLLSYHVALLRGTDIDKPKNLAKSVTVE